MSNKSYERIKNEYFTPDVTEQELARSSAPLPCSRFSFVDVVTKGSEGTLNLFFDDYPVAWVNNLHVAQQIREYLSENNKSTNAEGNGK